MGPSSSRLEAIADVGRGTRTRTPRWLWIVAAIVGIACAAVFVISLARGGEPPSHDARGAGSAARVEGGGRLGFGAGVVVGISAGIAIGAAIARQRRAPVGR